MRASRRHCLPEDKLLIMSLVMSRKSRKKLIALDSITIGIIWSNMVGTLSDGDMRYRSLMLLLIDFCISAIFARSSSTSVSTPVASPEEIRRNGGGLLPSQPISKNAENRVIEHASKKVSVRIFSIEDPQFIYLHIHVG